MARWNVRIAYQCRNGNVHSLNIDWTTREYAKDTWDPRWASYLEAKLSKDVDDVERELINSGFKKVGGE